MGRLSEALDRARATNDDAADLFVLPAGSADNNNLSDAPGLEAFPCTDAPEAPWDPSAYRLGNRAAGKVVVGTGAKAGFVEQYRRLAAVLHHAQLQRGIRSVMIASAVASEGKTLTATNVALTLSHSYQRRVLLIDADLRRPDLHEMFGLQNHVGLGDRLKYPDVNLPAQKISPTLSVLTAGQPNPDPMSALVSDTMKALLAKASQQFDWLVVDTPPVALMPDANLLAGMIDSALIVVSANTTPYPLVRVAVDAIGASRILGVVLNRAHRAAFTYPYFPVYDAEHVRPSPEK